MSEFLQNYEKQSEKLSRLHKILSISWLVGMCLMIVGLRGRVYSNWILFVFMLCIIFAIRKVNEAFVSNVNTISYKWMNDLDVEFAFGVFRVLLQDKKRKDYAFVLSAYLNFLIIMCQFDEFDAVYQENQKLIQKSLYRMLPFYRETFLGMAEERSEYREIIFRHIFSKDYDKEKQLTKKEEALRKRDEHYMVQQMYEMGDYEGLLGYIKKIHMVTKYDHILYGAYIQRCLYHLDHRYEIILPEAPEFFCVRYLKHLKDTGEAYYFEGAKEFADRCKGDYHVGKKLHDKRFIKAVLVLFVVGIILGLFI